ncbi:hypothetical protein [Bacterioplanoides pacificum]|uniref:Uncharacterized protein n=1 Tax=Bacterioplanoides pacificum TaxID=1171596 RepID=A0ABV7VSM9_9GAMM
MNYPHFLAVDGSSWEDQAHPVAIAWSLADGSIKTTLIQPEDDWQDWDYALEDLHGISQDTLYQRGETCWSVLRELEHDLEQPHLACDDLQRTEQLLEKLYDACGRDVGVEISAYQQDIADPGIISEVRDNLQLSEQTCDDRVRLMLEVWAREHG